MITNKHDSSKQVVTDRDTGAFRGFCYVEFQSLADLNNALMLDGVLCPAGPQGERALRVHVARGRRDSNRSTGRSGSVDGTQVGLMSPYSALGFTAKKYR